MKRCSISWSFSLLSFMAIATAILIVDAQGKPESFPSSSLSFLRTTRRWFPPFRSFRPKARDDSSNVAKTSTAMTTAFTNSETIPVQISNDDDPHQQTRSKNAPLDLDLERYYTCKNSTTGNVTMRTMSLSSHPINTPNDRERIKSMHGTSYAIPSTVTNHQDEHQQQQSSFADHLNAELQQESNIKSGRWIGGGILAALKLDDTRSLVKWGLAGFQIGILYIIGHAVWQATQDVLSELEEQTSSSNNGQGTMAWKRNVVNHVLETLDRKEQPTDHFALYRIAQRLQFVTGWQLFESQCDNEEGSDKPCLQRLLLSLTRTEYSILEQCLYIPTSNESNPRTAWNKVLGIPEIQQSILDRLYSMNFCPKHNPYAPILMDNHAGLLLYGPPGCGKTMLLQAISSTMRAPCFIVTPSVLLRKYVGETNTLIRSLFQLAQKFGGCVICLDELDGLFRERRQDEHDSSRELKTEFMQWWDGLKDDNNSRILVVGATNRPFDVDPAILRRMPQSHFVGLPMAPARQLILQRILEQLPTAPDLNISDIVASTDGFAPSDLVHLVRTAALLGPLREGRGNHSNFRPLSQQDLQMARQQVGPTPLSNDYRTALIQFHQQHRQGQQQQQQQPFRQQQQQQQQQHQLQSTPYGNFYHAGTFSFEGPDDGESDANALINSDDNQEELDEDCEYDEQAEDGEDGEED